MQKRAKDPYNILDNLFFIVEPLESIAFRNVTKQIIKELKRYKCKEVLEVACGYGLLAKKLSQEKFKVTGVDRSKTMIERAQKKKRAKKLIFADASTVKFKKKFDAAIIQIALHEMDPPIRKKIWNNMHNAVKKDGILIAIDFTVPKHKVFLTDFAHWATERGEKSMIKHDSAHYTNYKQFMGKDGLSGWLMRQNNLILSDTRFFRGNLGVIVVKKK